MRDGGTLTLRHDQVPAPGPDGEPEALGVIAAEVTEIRRAETDRMQLAALVQAAPDAIVARDRDGRIATWNPGAEQMFGLTAEEAIGRNYVELMVPEDERERVAAHRRPGATPGRRVTGRSLPAARRRLALPGADLARAADAARRHLARARWR